MLRQGVKLATGAVASAILALALLTAASHAIEALTVGFGLKALLSLALYLTFGALSASALVAAALRVPPAEPIPPLRTAAERIARLLEVPIVTFGHTHDEGVSRLALCRGRTGWYFNTGTWLAVFTHDVLMPRERVQYTFLRVRDRDAELLQCHGRFLVQLLRRLARPPEPGWQEAGEVAHRAELEDLAERSGLGEKRSMRSSSGGPTPRVPRGACSPRHPEEQARLVREQEPEVAVVRPARRHDEGDGAERVVEIALEEVAERHVALGDAADLLRPGEPGPQWEAERVLRIVLAPVLGAEPKGSTGTLPF